MLSIGVPSDPSCSSKLPALKTDERPPEQLALQEADPAVLHETPTPNFCIRDYVFTSRSKGAVGRSWPFPQHCLQFCLKHGVQDPLPPFEPPSLVRAKCSSTVGVEQEQSIARLEAEQIATKVDSHDTSDGAPLSGRLDPIQLESCVPLDKSGVGCSNQAQYPSPEERKSAVDQGADLEERSHSDAEIVSTVRSEDQTERSSNHIIEQPCSVSVDRSISEASSELEVAEPSRQPEKNIEILSEASGKKCRLIVRLGGTSDTGPPEDLASNSSTVSDPMASKVCPVCKTFTSTSNTTLNAHIDQCLSVESNLKWVATKLSKPKVKPRKKRLMVDIYDTAPRCTLEDLDRRNGTNWALELAVTAPANEASTETKRPKLSPVDHKEDGNERAVYVDSNGIKLRILSQFNDAPSTLSREEFTPMKHAKDIKSCSKSILMGRKKHFAEKYSKNMNLKAQRRKLRSFSLLEAEMPEGEFDADGQEKSSAGDQVKSIGSATIRQWVCSKRSDLPKKSSNKDMRRTTGNLVPKMRNQLAENSQPDSGNSTVVRSHILKFSRSSKDLNTSPKTKRVDFLSNAVHPVDDWKKSSKSLLSNSGLSSEGTSTHSLLLKISRRTSGNFASSPRSKREEIHMGNIQESEQESDESDAFLRRSISERCEPSMKDQETSILVKDVLARKPSFSLDTRKGDVSENTSKRFRKHRSILRTGKRGTEFPSIVKSGKHGSVRDPEVEIARSNTTPVTNQTNVSNCVRPKAGGFADHRSPSRTDILENEDTGEGPTSTQELGHDNMEKLPLGDECHDPEIVNMEMTANFQVSGDCVTKPSKKQVAGKPATNRTVNSENLMPTFSERLDPRPSGELLQSVSTGEAHEEEMTCGDESHDEIINQETQNANTVEFRGGKESCAVQFKECQVKSLCIPEPSACLTSHGDVGLEIHQENSSITSLRASSDHDQNLANDQEHSGSPISTASTISLPSPKDSKFTGSEEVSMAKTSAAQYKLLSAIPSAVGIGAATERTKERRNLEVKTAQSTKKAERPEDQAFCCSCRESLSRESPLMRQSATPGTMAPSKGKQIPNVYIGPRISSSFSSYKSPRAGAVANSNMESPTQPTSAKCASDTAVKFPIYRDLGSPSPSSQFPAQSTANPVLRLMGKNLTVVNSEELLQPQIAASNFLQNAECFSPGFVSSNNVLKESFPSYQPQHLGGSPVFGQALPMGNYPSPLNLPSMQVAGFVGTPLHNGHGLMVRPDQQTQPKMSYNMPVFSSRAPNMMKEVIVIDDSPEPETEFRGSLSSPSSILPPTSSASNQMLQRPFACFPSHPQFLSRDISGGPIPLFPNMYPRGNAHFMKPGNSSEGLSPYQASPIVFHSTTAGHLSPPLHYSQTLR